jgi:putative tryptophan/tyrosine transport system substrate-binding protein
MRRRNFIAGLAGATVAWPLAVRAQQTTPVRRIGVLQPQAESESAYRDWRMLFVSRLRELGWTDGENLQIDYRFGSGEGTSVGPIAKELVNQHPDALFAITSVAALALRQYTLTIPTVFIQVGDPVAVGLVTNLARPNGNITGFTLFDNYQIGSKWIDTLKDTVPGLTWAAILFEAGNTIASQFLTAIETAVVKQKVRLIPVPIATDSDVESAFAAFPDGPGGSLVALPNPIIIRQRKDIVTRAVQRRLPVISGFRIFATDGGLMSYGPDLGNQYRLAAGYIDRILRGTRPTELPIQQPTKYELVINLKTAKALGLTVPQSLLATADELIE